LNGCSPPLEWAKALLGRYLAFAIGRAFGGASRAIGAIAILVRSGSSFAASGTTVPRSIVHRTLTGPRPISVITPGRGQDDTVPFCCLLPGKLRLFHEIKRL